jgi:hypothetical protein
LAQELSADDWNLINRLISEKVSRTVDEVKARRCKNYQHLRQTQHPPRFLDNGKMVVNLSEMPLEEAACSALSKGLNFAMAPASLPVKDNLCGVKAIGTIPEEAAEEIRQEIVRILKGSHKPKDNLTGAERRDLRSLKANEAVTVLPADKGNATMVLNTSDYKRKIAALLEDKAYKKLKKDPTDAVERKTVLLLKKSPISDEVCQQLQLQGSRPHSLYGLPNIHEPDVPLRPIVSTIGSPTYRLAKYFSGLLSNHTGNTTPREKLSGICSHVGFFPCRPPRHNGQF